MMSFLIKRRFLLHSTVIFKFIFFFIIFQIVFANFKMVQFFLGGGGGGGKVFPVLLNYGPVFQCTLKKYTQYSFFAHVLFLC